MKKKFTSCNEAFPIRFDTLVEENYESDTKFANDFNEYIKKNNIPISADGSQETISPQTVCNYRYGNRRPNFDMFVAIADFFDVSYDYLLGKSDARKRENIDLCTKTGLSEQAINYIVGFKEMIGNYGVLYTDFLNAFLSDPQFMDSFLLEDFWNCMIRIRSAKYLLETVETGMKPEPKIDPKEVTKINPRDKEMMGKPLDEVLSDKEKDILKVILDNTNRKSIIHDYNADINNNIYALSEYLRDYFESKIEEFIKGINKTDYDGILPRQDMILDMEIYKHQCQLKVLRKAEEKEKREKE